MQKYIDKTYYQNTYKGKVSEEKLDNLIIEASKKIQKYTLNRSTDDIEEVKHCCCVIVDEINEHNEKKANYKKQGNKKSESVGSWSIGYGDVKTSAELEKEKESSIFDIIKLYLSEVTDKDGINLLYRGN